MKTREHTSRHGRARYSSIPLVSLVLIAAALAALCVQAKAPQGGQQAQKRQDGQNGAANDKGQADQLDGLFNTEEYVQIKPEEVGVGEPGRELEATSLTLAEGAAKGAGGEGPTKGSAGLKAEHKSADEELNAQLAHDSIGALESSSQAGARAIARPADERAARPQYLATQPRGPHVPMAMHPHGRPAPSYVGPRAHRSPYGPPQGPPRAPQRGYMALKGKLASGISSMVPHVPRPYSPMAAPAGPAPAGPPRYLPRGAAAGYAAFRDFVRTQTSRYKQQGGMGAPEPVAHNAALSTGPSYGAPAGADYGAKLAPPPAAPKGYGPAPAAYEPAAAPAPMPAPAYGADLPPARGPAKAKLTVTQAYIPHLKPAAAYGQAKPAESAVSGYAGPVNPVLAKLYGGQVGQGIGRPEYSKDFGMVIHYPQATVYTEPMSMDQLHKLAGTGITQILEHLQQNIASGQHDESNTIRANKKHHLGHGLTIHAKEYYAPGKSGRYVPTTAAVISSSGANNKPYGAAGVSGYGSASGVVGSSYGPPAAAGGEPGPYSGAAPQAPANPNLEAAAYGMQPELGSGYQRVKAAVAASSTRYNQPAKAVEAMAGGAYGAGAAAQSDVAPSQYAAGQPAAGANKFEPLGAVANIIGSELESLYNKANSVLSKQIIDPEIHAHVQAHLKSLGKLSALKYTEHDHRAPLVMRPVGHEGARQPRPYGPPASPAGGPAYPRPPNAQAMNSMRGRAPRRPHYPGPQHGARPSGRYPPPAMFHDPHRPPRNQPNGHHHHHNHHHHHYHPQQQQQQQQQQQYPEQQAVQQQMAQIMHELQMGDEQYSPRGHPGQAGSQGYPNKVMQKYQLSSTLPSLEHTEGLEIPQGPNDQIGEISGLMEALKGTLEAHRPEPNQYGQAQSSYASPDKVEEVHNLAKALGQPPSYAIQVSVSQPQQQQQQAYQAGEEASKKGVQAGYQQPQQQQPEYQTPSYGLARSEQAAYQNQESAGAYGQHVQGAQAYQQPQQTHAAQTHELKIDHVVGQEQPQQATYGASPAQMHGAYGQQQQQQQPQPEQAAPADYQQQSSGAYAAPAQAGYQSDQQQQQHSGAEQQTPNQQQPYQTSEHTQVVNHLVPVQQPAQASSDGYSSQQQQGQQLAAPTSAVAQQPAHQISVAEPSESQYLSAQPLSSFLDALPSDYQELLRQPAGHSSVLENLESSRHDTSASGGTKLAGAGSSSGSSSSSPASSSSSLSSHLHQDSADQQQAAASSFSSTYQQQQPLSAKAAAYHAAASGPAAAPSAFSQSSGPAPASSSSAQSAPSASAAAASSSRLIEEKR